MTDRHLPTLEQLEHTVSSLGAAGFFDSAQASQLQDGLVVQYEQSRYVLKNLAAHLGIGVIFAFDVIPLPLGTICRVAWVAGARVVETVRRNPERARVHSLGVLLVAAIPWLGYAAYLLPLRRNHRELAYVLANHVWLERTGRTYEQMIASRGGLVARFARWLVPLPWKEDRRADNDH